MKKKLLLIAIPALMVMSSCTYLESATKVDLFKEDTVAHEELFGKAQPKQLGVPEDTPADNPAWTSTPKVGVQFKKYEKVVDSGEWYYAVRFVAAIKETDGMTATWTRAVSEKDSNQIAPLNEGGGHISAATYPSLKNGDATVNATSEGDPGEYDKYVVYTMYDIPEAQSESYVAAYLTLSKSENHISSKVVATQVNGRNYFSFAADRPAGYFMEIIHGENKTIVAMDDTPSGTDVAKKENLALSAGDEFEYFYYNPETAFQCFGYSTFNREYYYFEKSATSEYFKIRVDGTYTFTPNENKLLYGSCSAADVTLYLKVNSNWSQDSAKFSVHYNDNDEFVALTQIGESDVYKLEHYNFKAHASILFARHDSSGTYTWGTKWNQTSDIAYDGSGGNDNPAKSMYTLNDGWDYCGGSWSIYSAE